MDPRKLPKAELHVHIEGTFEPELMFAIGERNGVPSRFASVDEVRAAYHFTDLQSFLEIYYKAAAMLRQEQDFYDLAWAYFQRAQADGVRHVEFFFDPQAHTERGVPFPTVIEGLTRAADDASDHLGLSAVPILCFLRHLSTENAMETLEASLPFKDRIVAVGLDSSEMGNPPSRFKEVFDRAREEGYRLVAHAGEEGPPAYVWQALDVLGVERIDHGVRSLEDPALVRRLAADRVPLGVCPLSNVMLRVVDTIQDHMLERMLDAGLNISINSDDPSYFGGYIGDNYAAVKEGLGVGDDDLVEIAHNSFEASFLTTEHKKRLAEEIDLFVRSPRS